MLISQASSERMLQDKETAQEKQDNPFLQSAAYQIKKVLEINKQTNKQTKHKIGDKSSCAFLTLWCPEEWSEKGGPFSGFSASTLLRDNNGVGGCAIPSSCIYLLAQT